MFFILLKRLSIQKPLKTAQITARLMSKPFSTFDGLHEHDRTGVGLLLIVELILLAN